MKHAVNHIHFVGIGGAGMSGIAEILHNLGYTVSGSDQGDNAVTRRLASLGIRVHVGHDHLRRPRRLRLRAVLLRDGDVGLRVGHAGLDARVLGIDLRCAAAEPRAVSPGRDSVLGREILCLGLRDRERPAAHALRVQLTVAVEAAVRRAGPAGRRDALA